ncbi:MAG: hypothetical protein LUI13_04450 [Lachnospiraceae bacterium]|nr:hypothetical protein [Lachnospiraceae bacterium]
MSKKASAKSVPQAGAFLLILVLLGYLLLCPQTAADSARSGLVLWYHSVLPVIFPFLFLSSVMIRIVRAEDLPAPLIRPLTRLFGCSPYGAFAILAGILCGLPVGAKLTSDLYQEQKIERDEALRMIGFVNNLSPGFLLSYVAVGLLGLHKTAWYIPASVLGAALFYGWATYRFRTRLKCLAQRQQKHINNKTFAGKQGTAKMSPGPAPVPALGNALNDSIFDAMESALRLCAYILLFAILSGALMQAVPMANPCALLLVSSIEVTNGTRLLAQSALPFPLKYLSITALAAFGGFSALAQSIGIAHMDREFLIDYIKSRVKITLLAILFAAATLLLQNSIYK